MLKLKLLRLERRWPLQTVAVVTRINQPKLSLIENGRLIPSPKQLARLAAVFKIPPDELLRPIELLTEQNSALAKVGRLHLRVAELERAAEAAAR